MRFTSLIVELVRARPRLMFWIVVLLQAALWLIVPSVFYESPPGDVATVLAFGREYQLGYRSGPPIAYWLGDVAFRLAGNSMFGVYLLAQICFVVTFWALFALSRAIVGAQQAILAILLTCTIAAFSFPGVEYGPSVLACPVWALMLLHAWQIVGQGRRNAWFALSIETGILLLTTSAAIPLLLVLIVFALATARGRAALASTDPVFAAIVVLAIVLPYLTWVLRTDSATAALLPSFADVYERLQGWGELLLGMAFAVWGVALLVIFNSGRFNRKPEEAPVIYRPSVDPLARIFVYTFALAPPVILSAVAALYGRDRVAGGDGAALLLAGLAVIVTAGDLIYLRRQHILRSVWLIVMAAPVVFVIGSVFIQPWIGATEARTSLPANAIGKFFGENFERRVGRPLASVAGDPQISTLIGIGASARPHVMFDAAPQLTPWLTPARFSETGGIVVWRASDTAGTPPADIARRFPGLVPEVPRTFDRIVKGRQSPLRIGWAVVRPQGALQSPR